MSMITSKSMSTISSTGTQRSTSVVGKVFRSVVRKVLSAKCCRQSVVCE
mgnify:CR=1 FL=1